MCIKDVVASLGNLLQVFPVIVIYEPCKFVMFPVQMIVNKNLDTTPSFLKTS